MLFFGLFFHNKCASIKHLRQKKNMDVCTHFDDKVKKCKKVDIRKSRKSALPSISTPVLQKKSDTQENRIKNVLRIRTSVKRTHVLSVLLANLQKDKTNEIKLSRKQQRSFTSNVRVPSTQPNPFATLSLMVGHGAIRALSNEELSVVQKYWLLRHGEQYVPTKIDDDDEIK